jgi:hypothetical protein
VKRSVVGLVALALLSTACVPWRVGSLWTSSYSGDFRADLVWYEFDGGGTNAPLDWWQVGQPDPIFVSASGSRAVPGNYAGSPAWETAFVSDLGEWVTAGDAGTISVPRPDAGPGGLVPVPADYDADGFTEPAWFRYGDATWHIEGAPPVQVGIGSNNLSPDQPQGRGADIPVPADYDGDGAAEPATFSPLTATWHIEGFDPIQYGRPGDVPVPANYIGTHHADLAVYNTLDGDWRVRGLSTPLLVVPGEPAALPAPADYDGDTYAEAAYIDDLTGEWFVEGQGTVATLPSSDAIPAALPVAVLESLIRVRFIGQCELDVLLCPDSGTDFIPPIFNDDGDTSDPVWVDSNGVWWKIGQATPLYTPPASPAPSPLAFELVVPGDYDAIPWWEPAFVTDAGLWVTGGAAGTIHWAPPGDWPSGEIVPVPADYNRDGITDPAWYRYTDATWFIRGMAPIQFGTPGAGFDDYAADMPVPADYDGDGDTDIATYSPLTATWHVRGQPSRQFGEPGALPVPANYFGDAAVELASVSLSTNTWHVEGRDSVVVAADDASILPIPFHYDDEYGADLSTFDFVTGEWTVVGLGVIGTLPRTEGYRGQPAIAEPAQVMHGIPYRFLNECWHDVITNPGSDGCGYF